MNFNKKSALRRISEDLDEEIKRFQKEKDSTYTNATREIAKILKKLNLRKKFEIRF